MPTYQTAPLYAPVFPTQVHNPYGVQPLKGNTLAYADLPSAGEAYHPSWKKEADLRSVGLDVPYHKDWKTFPKLSGSRGLEIKDWLDDHPKVKLWCAIDDDNSFSIEMRSNLVLVDAENGISFKDYLKARSLLRK